MSFELLSEPIRRYVRDKRWEELRPIQNAAISKILTTDDNYILASPTASGKTEAAFLPILSTVNFDEPGVRVLYISPLKALINDQFQRVEELCKDLDVTVTKWHGDASQARKRAILKTPTGIVLITPESLEAMFANKPFNIRLLFSHLRFVVLDEVHSFLGTDRGIQLKSLLSRLQDVNDNAFRVIGLSATIGEYAEAKRLTGDENCTKVLLDRSIRDVEFSFRYFKGDGSDLPFDLVEDLYSRIRDQDVLIFPNSRGRTEEVAVKLKRIAARKGGHSNYFSHHSSVDRDTREYVEFFAKSRRQENFVIVCTSTLELGIDIGSIDQVVQIDATGNVSSLIQRLGRSGRKEGKKGKLLLYATNRWSLLQALSCWELYQDGFIEPPHLIRQPFDILMHQILSIAKGFSGLTETQLLALIARNFAFSNIDRFSIQMILEHLIEIGLIERIGNELIIGLEGEKLVNNREFYSVFQTEENLKVFHGSRKIGEIAFSPQAAEGENILLAANIWKIREVDHRAMKVYVSRANDGKKPIFGGSGVDVHPAIRERMLKLLTSDTAVEYLDEAGTEQLRQMRKEFSQKRIHNLEGERPLVEENGSLRLYTFTGTRINRSLQVLLEIAGIPARLNDRSTSLEIEDSEAVLRKRWHTLGRYVDEVDSYFYELLNKNPSISSFSKWSAYLPKHLQIPLLKERRFDFSGAANFIASTRLVSTSST